MKSTIDESFMEAARNAGDAFVLFESRPEWKDLLISLAAQGWALTTGIKILGKKYVFLTQAGAKNLLGIESSRKIDDLQAQVIRLHMNEAEKNGVKEFTWIAQCYQAVTARHEARAAKASEKARLSALSDAEKQKVAEFKKQQKAALEAATAEFIKNLRKA